jgi:hypothetical protein
MSIVLIGASGNAGSRIRSYLIAAIRAIARHPEEIAKVPNDTEAVSF